MQNDSLAIQLLKKAAETKLTPSEWVLFHKIKNEAGIPIEFADHKFMRAFYDDMSPLQVMLKAPQIGATVAELIKTFFCAKKNKWDIIYTLPTASDVNDMAGGKVNRILAQNPILLEWVKDHDTVDQKAVGENIIYYRGTYTAKQAMMVSSDLNVHDEVDASDPEVITQYETRLQAKANGKRWYFSHPSLAGKGVDIYWQQSDKKEWFITCNNCKVEQQLSWPDNVDIMRKIYVCSACKNELPTRVIRNGLWKHTSSGIFSGYHISQLMCPWIPASKIVLDYETKDKQYFYNYVLGLPFVGGENKIDPAEVLKNCTDAVNDQTDRIIIGVDTGLPIHYVCLNKQGVFHYGKCKAPSAEYDPYSEIENLLKRWSNSFVVADQGGDLIGIRKLQAKYPGRVFLCYYRKDKKEQKMITWGEGDKYGDVYVDRNRMISFIGEQLKETRRIALNGSKDDFDEFASHFGNIYREIVVVKETPGKDNATLYGNYYVWKRNGPDHYVHSFVYALTGLDKYATQEGIVVQSSALEGIAEGRIMDYTQQFGY